MSFLERFKSKKVKIGVGVVVLASIGVGTFYVYPKYIKPNTEVGGEFENVIETYSIPENEKIFINGSIVPKESKDFALLGEEEVNKVNVTNGQYVNKGDLLYSCKNPSSLSEIENLNIQISELKKQKNQTPQDAEVPADQSIDVEISKLNAQVAALNKKAYTSTYAPFSGKVYINEKSETPEQGAASFMTLQSTEFYMKGKASEQDLAKIKIDQSVDILVFSTNEKLTGHISFISDRPSDQTDNTMGGSQGSLSYYDINVSFDSQENLVNGFHIQATVEVENASPKIPASSILKDGETSYVFKSLDGILKKQVLELKEENEEYAVIQSGLEQNDVIIKYPTEDMKEGDEVFTDGGGSFDESVGSLDLSKDKVGY
ncbi:efflux RND transporter periplasmic adaptor subunit [Romboutsia weinsteinii]|uniref:Efflux RND transporter periplasmic adaptor subunit n=1 Tax=Romboutsia weinsteinii TaxID=2020949 RepID=A0A371J255_9FIRM|nr:efflux RND transporter periplasmic adaptor subunit [Romboutsia weinsteinii]RDY26774.1 efflux RND transporter periplasmic adaptor subunit [Romboutsia weinsteinii]